MTNMGSGNLLVIIKGAFGNSYKGVQSVLEMTFFLGSASVALVQVLTLTALAQALHSYATLCNSMDSSPPGSSAHGILQTGILKWVAIFFSRGIFSTQGSNLLHLLHWRAGSLPLAPPGKPQLWDRTPH